MLGTCKSQLNFYIRSRHVRLLSLIISNFIAQPSLPLYQVMHSIISGQLKRNGEHLPAGRGRAILYKDRPWITVRWSWSSIESIQVVSLAKDTSFVQGKFFTGAELPTAGVASETGQMIDVFTSPSHPVGCWNRPAATSTFRSKSPVFFFFRKRQKVD